MSVSCRLGSIRSCRNVGVCETFGEFWIFLFLISEISSKAVCGGSLRAFQVEELSFAGRRRSSYGLEHTFLLRCKTNRIKRCWLGSTVST